MLGPGRWIQLLRRGGFRVYEIGVWVATVWSRICGLVIGGWKHKNAKGTKIFCHRGTEAQRFSNHLVLQPPSVPP